MGHVVRDFRYAVRSLVRTPMFTLIALVSIALGIGANAAIFTLLDQVLLRTLPVRDPGQLVLLKGPNNNYGNNRGFAPLSFPMYEDFRDNFVERRGAPALPRVSAAYAPPTTTPILSGVFARFPSPMNVGVAGQTERVPGELVSGTYFEVLGVGAALGRVITPADDGVRGAGAVAVISYRYWQNRFGGDPGVVGRQILVDNYPFTIVGVSAAGFTGIGVGNTADIRVPIMMKHVITPLWDDLDNRRSRWANVFARLEPGVTRERAQAALQPFFHSLLESEVREKEFAHASAYTREQFLKGTITLLPAAHGLSFVRDQLTRPLWVLMAIVATVLLIACANVASLLVARASARQKEIAVRLALGASRGRIVGQLLVESLLLSGAGAALGLFLASWGIRVLLPLLPASNPSQAISGSIDGRVLAFTVLVALATGLLFGLLPALRSSRPDLAPTLKDQIATVVGGGVGLRKTLVVAQVTMAVLLLVGAGLFIRTLRNLQALDLGVRPESIVSFKVYTPISGYSSDRSKQFMRDVAERLRGEPGVRDVAFADLPLLEGDEWDSTVTVEGYTPKQGEYVEPYCNDVSPSYFRTMGIPLLAGRDFDDRDASASQTEEQTKAPDAVPSFKVAIANQAFVRRYVGDRNPIGRHVGFGGNPATKTPIEIIGVVADAKYTGVRDEIPPQLFFPYFESDFAGAATFYVRSAQTPEVAFGAARRALQAIDPNVPMYGLRTLEDQIDRSLLNERLVAMLSTAFGLLATILALIGLYGVMAYTVARRTREIGVRMALGAASGDVVSLIMREVLTLVGGGVALGLVLAIVLTRLLRAQLFGIAPNDPLTIVAAALALASVALLAGYVPARRATRVDPVRALRYE